MKKYNVKIRSFANNEKQVRIYSNPLYRSESDTAPKKEQAVYFEENPFTGEVVCCSGVKDYDGSWLDYNQIPITWKNQETEEAEKLEDSNERSLYNSVIRTKKAIYDYARSNVWDWFVTFTFSPEKVDSRYNREDLSKLIRKWLNNQKNRYASDLKYIVVHEFHKDGASHFHGLFSNCGNMKFDYWKTIDGLAIYNITGFRYGFTTASRVQDSGRSSSYILKYITKELCENVKGRNRYFASHNLDKPSEEVLFLNDWELNDYRLQLASEMKYYKQVKSEYVDVEYFEMKG